MQLFIAILTVT